jgi:hypothetical protein
MLENFFLILPVPSPSAIIQNMMKQNWFPTLNAALESEGLLESWEVSYPPIGYGETYTYTWQDGTKYGHLVSVYRDTNGSYERPVHYQR